MWVAGRTRAACRWFGRARNSMSLAFGFVFSFSDLKGSETYNNFYDDKWRMEDITKQCWYNYPLNNLGSID